MKQKYLLIPDQKELAKWFRYNPDTGILYRIAELNRNTRKTQEVNPERAVGTALPDGYLVCHIPRAGRRLVARIVWMIQTGEDPCSKQIDHINGERHDNRWKNLRLATKAENMRNRAKHCSMNGVATLSAYKGVSYEKNDYGQHNRIIAQIRVDGRLIRLGTFPTEEAAHAAYCDAAKKYHGEFARLE